MRAEDRRILVETLKVICRRDVVVVTGSALGHGVISCRTKGGQKIPFDLAAHGHRCYSKVVHTVSYLSYLSRMGTDVQGGNLGGTTHDSREEQIHE